ncbi:MAG TPA: 30S ribosomal protein S6--L-glutamate ligase [Thermoanaerobaculia bacterium]|nr:30S ribosomal protein S6--L-glutamate ligase [Thermoanaerobaculia bacterium]
MKIGILSRRPDIYSTRRLREAAEARGHHVEVVDYLRCYMNITAERPAVMLGGRELDFDAVVPRIGASHTFYGTAVVRQFEVMGVFPCNESTAIVRARDKLRSVQLLAREGISLPVTGFAHSIKDVEALVKAVGGAPLIVKLLEGTQGIGVMLIDSDEAARSVIAAFRQVNADILVQQFIDQAAGADYRTLVVGGEVIAAMRRQAAAGEFRANLHRGGTAEPVELSAEERDVSVRAAAAVGLVVAGVDFLRTNRGPLVIEVNSSPGLEGIEGATGVDVAGAIVRFVEGRIGAEQQQRRRNDD